MSSGGIPPAGAFMPGTKVQVGSHRVVVERYLSEGGFAHVYVVRLPKPFAGTDLAVLKRVAVPDKIALSNMRVEVETMKKLKGHRHIVTYIDSHASQLKGGGYEVFLLMEFCAGGGLIDFMNTRLQNRLTEPEILKIFTDVAEGVACMHYLKPPLLHRDLKVENVLISVDPVSQAFSYKLCDFGSAAPPRPAATNAHEGRLIEDDVQRHTTMQYRSPEMIDVYRGHPIDEKADIWALGVFLYKLCYYTTPFEEAGQMAILNASFKYPAYPPFSDRLKLLIAEMLREDPRKRPNIYEVLKEACYMRGKECPVPDIYAHRSKSESRLNAKQLPTNPAGASSSTPTSDLLKIGASFSPPIQETAIIPEVTPMRRGRPAKPGYAQPVQKPAEDVSKKPSPSPFRLGAGDPFSTRLDTSSRHRSPAEDELSTKFPTLEEFSLYHDKGQRYEFEPSSATTKEPLLPHDLSDRVTLALADEAFARPSTVPAQEKVSTPAKPPYHPASDQPGPVSTSAEAPSIYMPSPVNAVPEKPRSSADLRRDLTKQTTTAIHSPKPSPEIGAAKPHRIETAETATRQPEVPPVQTRPIMVSTGTMTSPQESPVEKKQEVSPSHRRVQSRLPQWPPRDQPDKERDEKVQLSSGELPPRPSSKHSPEKDESHASRRTSHEFHRPALFRIGSRSNRNGGRHGDVEKGVDQPSARASLDIARPSLAIGELDRGKFRSVGSNRRQRPASAYVQNWDQLREDHPRASLDSSLARPTIQEIESAYATAQAEGETLHKTRSESTDWDKGRPSISSDVDYLRAREEEGKKEHHGGNGSKGHRKRGSLAGLSFSGTKSSIMSGRFGDAFRKFESSNGKHGDKHGPRGKESTLSPEVEGRSSMSRGRPTLSPIHSPDLPQEGFPSEEQPGPQHIADEDLDNVDEDMLSPESRRDLERRRAQLEEQKVAAAAAEYRRQVAEQQATDKGGGAGGLARRFSARGGSKASAIQNKVQSLLRSENNKPAPKTASGYGRYTAAEAAQGQGVREEGEGDTADRWSSSQSRSTLPERSKPKQKLSTTSALPLEDGTSRGREESPPPKPPRPSMDTSRPLPSRGVSDQQQVASRVRTFGQGRPPSTTTPAQAPQTTGKPVAPPKPKSLRGVQATGNSGTVTYKEETTTIKRTGYDGTIEIEGEPGDPDWEEKFNSRFPSLSGLGMVETEIEIPSPQMVNTRDI